MSKESKVWLVEGNHTIRGLRSFPRARARVRSRARRSASLGSPLPSSTRSTVTSASCSPGQWWAAPHSLASPPPLVAGNRSVIGVALTFPTQRCEPPMNSACGQASAHGQGIAVIRTQTESNGLFAGSPSLSPRRNPGQPTSKCHKYGCLGVSRGKNHTEN